MYPSWLEKLLVVLWCMDVVSVWGASLDQGSTDKILQQMQQQISDLTRDLRNMRDKMAQLETRLDAANDNVVFHASLHSGGLVNVGANDVIIYDNVITNIGDSYNVTTGIFTAPVPASYFFQFSCKAPSGQTLNLTLQVNTEVKATCASLGEVTSGTAALQVMPGSKVKVVNSENVTKQLVGGFLTQFSGFLINAFAWQ